MMEIRKLKARVPSPAPSAPDGETSSDRLQGGQSSCFQLPYVLPGMITRLKLV